MILIIKISSTSTSTHFFITRVTFLLLFGIYRILRHLQLKIFYNEYSPVIPVIAFQRMLQYNQSVIFFLNVMEVSHENESRIAA